MHKLGIVILAAGASERLGRPKQFLPFRNKTFLQHIITESLAADLTTVVVEGATRLKDHTTQYNIQLVHNDKWSAGMGTSIQAGVKELEHCDAIIIAVCDQPYVSALLFQQLVGAWMKQEAGIVACTYATTAGTPVLFSQKYFAELLNLPPDQGARALLRLHANDLATIEFPEGAIDIDTEMDYALLSNH